MNKKILPPDTKPDYEIIRYFGDIPIQEILKNKIVEMLKDTERR